MVINPCFGLHSLRGGGFIVGLTCHDDDTCQLLTDLPIDFNGDRTIRMYRLCSSSWLGLGSSQLAGAAPILTGRRHHSL